jgi:hypothetical protein
MDLAEGRPAPHAFGRHVQSVECRWRILARCSLALITSLGACEAIWRLLPKALAAHTTTIGFATFANFDIDRYTDAYVLIGFVFPTIACLAYGLLTRIGPLRRTSRTSARLFPIRGANDPPDETEGHTGTTPPRAQSPSDIIWSTARLALTGAVVAFELSGSQSSSQQNISNLGYFGAALFLLTVIGGGLLHRKATDRRTSDRVEEVSQQRVLLDSISLVNSAAALLLVPGLYFISRSSAVSVISDHHVAHYPWLPLWLATTFSAISLGLWIRWQRQCTPRTAESNVLLWIVGPVLLFLATANLPGALGPFQGFDDAQNLAAPQLVFGHGLLPWRDLFIVHGLLGDVFSGAIGMVVFGNSRWGVAAGGNVFVLPAFWLMLYYFAAYFSRKNRIVMLGIGAVIVFGHLQIPSPQLLVAPICILLFAGVIERGSWGRCTALACSVVAAMVLVPEATIFEIALLPLVVVYELSTRTKSASLSSSLSRSVRCFMVGLFIVLVLIAYLTITRSLAPFVDFYVEFSSDNALSKGVPVQWVMHSDLTSTIYFFAPMVLWLATIGRVGTKLVLRSHWSTMDWTMVAAATCVILYYPKVIQRADVGHAAQVFEVCIPLVLLWSIELLRVIDLNLQSIVRALTSNSKFNRFNLRSVQFPATVSVVTLILLFTTSISTVGAVPGRFHPMSPQEPPPIPRLGYTFPGAVNLNLITQVGAVIRTYSGPHESVMDFTDQLGIIYYVLNRTPSTRYFHIDEAATVPSQQAAIDEIRQANPSLVIFSSMSFGLSGFDDIPIMVREYKVSEYLLDHYRPLVNVGSELILARNDLARHPKPLPHLGQSEVQKDLYFSASACNFGEVFNFFAVPSDLAVHSRVSARLEATSTPGVSRLIFPSGTDPLNYRWIEFHDAHPLGTSAFIISDGIPAQPSHSIDVESLPRSGRRIDALVSGCVQWHGYSTSSMYLTTNVLTSGRFGVSLIR